MLVRIFFLYVFSRSGLEELAGTLAELFACLLPGRMPACLVVA